MVGENVDHRACVEDDPGKREVAITLGKLVEIIGNKIFYPLHEELCWCDFCLISAFCTVMEDVTNFTTVDVAMSLFALASVVSIVATTLT